MMAMLCLLALSGASRVEARDSGRPADPATPVNTEGDIPDEIVRKVDPSVVAIQHERSGGSGFIISRDGTIMTNGHVVRGDTGENPLEPAKLITVILHNERKYRAKVLGFCMNPDVAVIQIDPEEELRPVEFADSTAVQVGQKCFAVGAPMGLKRTFTKGILSNVDRSDLDTFSNVFQTDAAINPGNSGGPLLDREGRVLGLNTYASRGANNLGFTVPIHVATVVKDHILKHGRFVRAEIPFCLLGEIYDELARALQVEAGVLVHYVMPGSDADRAGFKAGDIIVKTDGKTTSAKTKSELLDYEWDLATRQPGSEVTFTVLRGPADARREQAIRAPFVEAQPRIETGRWPGEIVTHKYSSLGLDYMQLTTLHKFYWGLPDCEGVLVGSASPGSPAAKADLRPQDVITAVDGRPVSGVGSFRTELEKCLLDRKKSVDLTLQRRKAVIRTALNPYYDLKGKRIAFLVPSQGSEYADLVIRTLVTDGAAITIGSASGTLDGIERRDGIAMRKTGDLKGSDYDVVLISDSAGGASRGQGGV
jgi:serine protease Do